MTSVRANRKLAAILAADVVGYSRMMANDEAATLAALVKHRELTFNPLIAEHNGRIVKLIGDGTLVEFASVVDAVNCGVAIQQLGQQAGVSSKSDGMEIILRIGINLGDVIINGDDIYGDGVNIAARLEPLARPGGICISSIVNESVGSRSNVAFRDGGEVRVKNMDRALKVFHWHPDGASPDIEPTLPAPETLGAMVLPNIAILPFQNLSGDPDQEYFAEGVVEDIINALSPFRSFSVIARNSSFSFASNETDLRAVADTLHVQYLVTGSIRRAGDRLRITAQLVEAANNTNLWSNRYDGSVDEVFDFQDRITEAIVSIIEPEIQSAEIIRARRKRSGSLNAYDTYLRALPMVLSEKESEHSTAFDILISALEDEPNNPLLLALASFILQHRRAMGWPSNENERQLCGELAERGVQYAAGDSIVLARCGMSLLQVSGDVEWGMSLLKSALDATPNSMMVLIFAGVANLHYGSIDYALECFHHGIKLSPRDRTFTHIALTGLAHGHLVKHEYAEAITFASQSFSINMSYDPTYWMLISAHAQLGQLDEAKRFVERFIDLAPDATISSIKAAQSSWDPERMVPIFDGLQLAGLPEN